jgi:hypothetical protein
LLAALSQVHIDLRRDLQTPKKQPVLAAFYLVSDKYLRVAK